MANSAELIKQRAGNPFDVWQTIERAASQGIESLSQDDLFLCKWYGLYTHRHEQDYFMLRTKQPNGFVTAGQLRAIADITEMLNRGYADVTTRQDFQLHWCHVRQVVEIVNRLKAVGISTVGACGDVLRNVVGCPVAGVDRDEVFDASPIAQQLSDFFLGNPEFANLPRKYKIGVTGCRRLCIHPEIHCVSLVGVARSREGIEESEPGFDLRIGGGLSTQAFLGQRLNAYIRREDAVDVVRCVTEIWRDSPAYREKRHHARFKYLVHDWGVVKFRRMLEERLGRPLEDAPSDYQEPNDTYRDHVGVHAQKQPGLYYVGAPILVGRVTSQQMRRIAELSERHGDGRSLRLTNRQNIVLLNIPEASVEHVLTGLADVGLSVNAHPVRRSLVTCTGTEFCKLAITETKARSRHLVEYLEKRVQLDEPLRLHITGCPNACAQYQIAHIGLMGSKTKVDGDVVDAYDVFIGGQMGRGAAFNRPVLRKIPATECAARLEHVLNTFLRERKGREVFNAWCARVGDERLAELLSGGGDHPLADVEEAPTPPGRASDGA